MTGLYSAPWLPDDAKVTLARHSTRGRVLGTALLTTGLLASVGCRTPHPGAPTPATASIAPDPVLQPTASAIATEPPPPPSATATEPGPDPGATSAPARRAAGEPCSGAGDCESGICEGEGCGGDEGRCASKTRACTRDLRVYCGCDGQTFRGSGSCPGQRFAHRGPC